MPLRVQLGFLLLLSLPIACASWTVTHEEVFRELREFCQKQSQSSKSLAQRKFFYLFTCEYCFSHYVALFFLVLTRFQMLLTGWSGYLIAWFALVWMANVYMSIFNRLRLDIKHENVVIATEQTVQKMCEENDPHTAPPEHIPNPIPAISASKR